jgi:hypothetical protein
MRKRGMIHAGAASYHACNAQQQPFHRHLAVSVSDDSSTLVF